VGRSNASWDPNWETGRTGGGDTWAHRPAENVPTARTPVRPALVEMGDVNGAPAPPSTAVGWSTRGKSISTSYSSAIEPMGVFSMVSTADGAAAVNTSTTYERDRELGQECAGRQRRPRAWSRGECGPPPSLGRWETPPRCRWPTHTPCAPLQSQSQYIELLASTVVRVTVPCRIHLTLRAAYVPQSDRYVNVNSETSAELNYHPLQPTSRVVRGGEVEYGSPSLAAQRKNGTGNDPPVPAPHDPLRVRRLDRE
jgi:hypothetical protein